MQIGVLPVPRNMPTTLPRGLMPVRSNSKMSCISTWSFSTPTTSAMPVTLRVPSLRRAQCTTILIALASCWRITLSGTCWLAIMTIVSRRENASRGELACTVVMEPS